MKKNIFFFVLAGVEVTYIRKRQISSFILFKKKS